MSALVFERPRPLVFLIKHPASWVPAGAALAATIYFAGILCGVGTMIVIGVLVTLCARWLVVRRWLERSARASAWRNRCDAREAKLDNAGVCDLGLRDATRLFEHLEQLDSQLCAHLQLEDLLDRYVELELRAKQCDVALDHAKVTGSATASAKRIDIRERVVESSLELRQRVRECREELDAIPELLGLLIQRSVLAATEQTKDPVGEGLAFIAAFDDETPLGDRWLLAA